MTGLAFSIALFAAAAGAADEPEWLVGVVLESESTSWSSGSQTNRRAIGAGITRRGDELELALTLAFTSQQLYAASRDYATPEAGVFLFPSAGQSAGAPVDLQPGVSAGLGASYRFPIEGLGLSLLPFADVGAVWAPGASASRLSAKSLDLGAGLGVLFDRISIFRFWAGARAGYRLLWLDAGGERDVPATKPSGLPIGIRARLELGPSRGGGLYAALSGSFIDETLLAATLGWSF